ncbi:hypothetical protein D9758_005250 [Tetrapyrgos nigripes]|uniref:DUF7729 domain-containing protein n=1 Tax=Tetrapyrgos nigripes TaxID=182062 RepID=A0A8H5LX19_9AGAR|nr:hypothetical protein D9758_005250 [Tetrapyrgos nigripes]
MGTRVRVRVIHFLRYSFLLYIHFVRVKSFFVFLIKPTRPHNPFLHLSIRITDTLPTSLGSILLSIKPFYARMLQLLPQRDQLGFFPLILTLLNEVLWGTCNPPGLNGSNDDGAKDECRNSLRDWVEDMLDNRQKEWGERNEIVVQTRVALLAYPLLSTSCLPLSNANMYCDVSSIAQGAAAASDIYLYSLPLGVGFPDSAKPSCGA